MTLQNPVSGLKKSKRPLPGGTYESGTGGTNAGDESVDGTDSILQPEPDFMARGNRDRPQLGNEADVNGERVGSMDPLPCSGDHRFVPVSEIGHNKGEREAVTEGREAGEEGLHLRSGVGVVVPSHGGGVDEERANQATLSPSESMESTATPQPLPPTTSSDNIDSSAIPGCSQQNFSIGEGEPGVASGNKLGWRLTASATAKSFLRTVKESSNAYPPLKSVAEGLYFILNNCGVRHPSHTSNLQCSWLLQRTEVNEQAVESLAPWIKTLSESLCQPIPPGDVNEEDREEKLER